MHLLTSENRKLRKISIILPFIPLLDAYELKFAPISFGEILLIAAILYSLIVLLIEKEPIIVSSNYYLWFLLYAFISSLVIALFVRYFSFYEWFFKWARLLLYSYVFMILGSYFIDLKSFANVFWAVGLIVSIAQYFQVIMWYIFGKPIFYLIPNFKLHYTINNYADYVSNLMMWNGDGWRPSNFFLEPEPFSQYATIAIICCLFLFSKPKIKSAIAITVAVLTSASATGIVLVAIIWIYWAFRLKRFQNPKIFAFSVSIIFVVLLIFLTKNRISNALYYRLGTIGQIGAATGSLRLLRGYKIFSQLSLPQQIFGTGMGSFKHFLITNQISTIYDGHIELGNEYMNTFSYILNNVGIIGTIIYIMFIISTIKKCRERYKKVSILSWIITILATSNFLTVCYAIPLMMIASENNLELEE